MGAHDAHMCNAQSADPVNPWIVLRKPRIGALCKRSTDWPRACELDFMCVLIMINEPHACSKLKSQRSAATCTQTQVYQCITERQRAGKYQRGSRNNGHGEAFSRPEESGEQGDDSKPRRSSYSVHDRSHTSDNGSLASSCLCLSSEVQS